MSKYKLLKNHLSLHHLTQDYINNLIRKLEQKDGQIKRQTKTIDKLEKANIESKKQRDRLECYMIAESYDFDEIQSIKNPKEK